MKTIAFWTCFPLLGAMWYCATIGDAMEEAFYGLEGIVDSLADYAEAE